ncbi:hypothetical protein WK53_19660 [Burkholderia ubonensis]|uniref:Uncharacterized protein n=1 Tax=Burkholderia ubonensis TaxID=101571 RepID=A0AAW3N0N1_9BURK|nr:hypothetical protein WK53_19660 [Burkholderia ubonensis]
MVYPRRIDTQAGQVTVNPSTTSRTPLTDHAAPHAARLSASESTVPVNVTTPSAASTEIAVDSRCARRAARKRRGNLGADVRCRVRGPHLDAVRDADDTGHPAYQRFCRLALVTPVHFTVEGHAAVVDFDPQRLVLQCFLPLERGHDRFRKRLIGARGRRRPNFQFEH